MSASSTPTCSPRALSAAARLTLIEDLPTPPFPEVTASTRVRSDSEMPFLSGMPRRFRSACFCSAVISSKASSTDSTPGSVPTWRATCSWKLSLSGQPAVVSASLIRTVPPSISIPRTIPSIVTGLPSSGSTTFRSAISICARERAIRYSLAAKGGRSDRFRRPAAAAPG